MPPNRTASLSDMCHWQLCCSRCRPLGVQPVLFSTWAALQMVWILKSAVEPCIWSSERSPLIWSRPTSLSPPALSPEYQSQQFKPKKGVQFQNQFYRTVWNRSQLVPTNQRMPSVRRKRLHPFPGKKQWTDPHWPCTPNFGGSSTMPVNTMLPEPRPMSKPLGKQYLQRLKVHFPMLHSWNSSQRKKHIQPCDYAKTRLQSKVLPRQSALAIQPPSVWRCCCISGVIDEWCFQRTEYHEIADNKLQHVIKTCSLNL